MCLCVCLTGAGQQATVSQIGPDELPPNYQQSVQNGVPLVTCRVCQAMIDISNKREQHVVKCNQCNEATVRSIGRNSQPGCAGSNRTSLPQTSRSGTRRQAKSTCAARATVC